jgi:TatD DNase family protein
MWIDTHCHLDADAFDADRDAVVARAREGGVSMMVIPAVEVAGFGVAAALAHRLGYAYALGIHPLYTPRAADGDIERLRKALETARNDPRLVAVGEIGLDYFVEGLDRERQEWFYAQQLKLARTFGLPVILHVRRSADGLLKYLNRHVVAGGIAHAFNGSTDQAQRLIACGLRLGFGGAMTYNGSLRIRQLASKLPDDGWVLETDAPDIPPQWRRDPGASLRNEPGDLPAIAQVLSALRRTPLAELALANRRNACAALPRLAPLLDKPGPDLR